MKNKVVIVTGAAHRVGAEIVKQFHAQGALIILHYRESADSAQKIADKLNMARENSVILVKANLQDESSYELVINAAIEHYNKIDVLVNNASSFYPTEIGSVTLDNWNDLMDSNLKAPFFLSQAAAPYLSQSAGCIINIVDIHAEKPLKTHSVYCMAKAGLVMMTKSLAKDLGPEIRVNAIAPGAIMWPEMMDAQVKEEIVSRTALKRKGSTADIAKTALFLAKDADYITGQVLAVDGGRSLNL